MNTFNMKYAYLRYTFILKYLSTFATVSHDGFLYDRCQWYIFLKDTFHLSLEFEKVN